MAEDSTKSVAQTATLLNWFVKTTQTTFSRKGLQTQNITKGAKMDIIYSHARNKHPAPPITIEVEAGMIKKLTIESEATRVYTGSEISALFKAAGLSDGRITIPLPDSLKSGPLNRINIKLIPGTYNVEHAGGIVILPENAFEYNIAIQP